MPTLTLDLPEATYRDALAFGATEQVRLFAVALRTARAIEEAEDDPDVPDYDRPTDEADLESIGRGLQAAAEGRTTPGDVVLARLRKQARNGRPPK